MVESAHTVRFERPSAARALGAVALLLVTTESASTLAADVTVRAINVQQRITGFGASSAWTATNLTSSEADLLFTPAGINLTLLRVRIAPPSVPPPAGGCTTLEVATAQAAFARGATVWATPWSPPPFWKSNGSVDYGGTLLPEHADDWASCLAGFVSYMASQGVPIAYLSAQNEPTVGNVDYDSCVYTPQTLADFISNNLAPAITAAGLTTPIVAPETEGWGTDQMTTFSAAILASAAAVANVGVFATHSYVGSPAPMDLPTGKELWQTEWYDKQNPGVPADPGIASALRVAVTMHAALVNANVSAWLYWWIKPQTADNGALWDATTKAPSKRLYAMGNFSRFVLPGFLRVQATTSAPNPDISVSAYTDPLAKQVVVVAINESPSAVSQTFLFDSIATGSWMSWVTSATENSTSPGTPVDGGANPGRLTYTLEGQSITTLVGAITGPGPALAPDTAATLNPPSQGGSGCACSSAQDRQDGRDGTRGMEGAALAAIVAMGSGALRRRARARAR
jgi:glucuronoarabinoxylan endo-1,4-beta-xylanase